MVTKIYDTESVSTHNTFIRTHMRGFIFDFVHMRRTNTQVRRKRTEQTGRTFTY